MVVVLVNYRDSRQTLSFAPTVLDYFGDYIQIEDLWTGKTFEVVDSQYVRVTREYFKMLS